MMHDADKIEAVHAAISEKYTELKNAGLIIGDYLEYGEVFKTYMSKVRSMLNSEVTLWTDALKDAKSKVNKHQTGINAKENLKQIEREVSRLHLNYNIF